MVKKPDEFLIHEKTIPLIPIAEYIYSLAFEEKPDYNRIRFYFTKNLLDQEMTPNNLYDWNQNAYQGNRIGSNSPISGKSSSIINSFHMRQIDLAIAREPIISDESIELSDDFALEFN